MGWTSYHASKYKNNGQIDRKAECDEYFEGGLNKSYYKVLKSVMVGSVYYAAITNLKKFAGKDENGEEVYVDIPENEREVWAAIFLTSTDSTDYFNFSYKNMDETVGPGYYDCPKSILNLLTPTNSEWANEWRNKCYANIEKKKSKTSLSKLPVGSEIKYINSDDEEVIAYKHSPAYQFKRPFWYIPAKHQYIKGSHIPDNFVVLRVG